MILYTNPSFRLNGKLQPSRLLSSSELEMFGSEADILLMNHQAASPFHGALTDVNLWRRVLSLEELEAWAGCRLLTTGGSGGSGGLLVNWETARLTSRGVMEGRVERSSTCYREENSLLISRTERTFEGTVQFCATLGGSMAVARTEEDLAEMLVVFSGECEASSSLLYTGHTDKQVEGGWAEVNTGLVSSSSWWRWSPGEPTTQTGEDCSLASHSGEMEDGQCSVLACPLCRLNNSPVPRLLKLRQVQL